MGAESRGAEEGFALWQGACRSLVKEGGQFAPAIGLPGIAMTALNSFNNLYGALHAEPVQVIRSNPVRVFATQEAIESTGSSASEIGAVLLQPGTYVLMSAGQAPTDDQLKNLTLAQDRIVRADGCQAHWGRSGRGRRGRGHTQERDLRNV